MTYQKYRPLLLVNHPLSRSDIIRKGGQWVCTNAKAECQSKVILKVRPHFARKPPRAITPVMREPARDVAALQARRKAVR